MHAKLTANLLAKKIEERAKKTGNRIQAQNLNEFDYLQALAPPKASKKKQNSTTIEELARGITFQSRLQNNDPLVFGLETGEEDRPSRNNRIASEQLSAPSPKSPYELPASPFKPECSFFTQKTQKNKLTPNHNQIEGEGDLRRNDSGFFSNRSQRSLMEDEGNGNTVNTPPVQVQNIKKLTPRERWRKAIRRVIVLRKFQNLNENLKVDANLYGRVKEHNIIVDSSHQKSCCVILPESNFKIFWSFIMVLALIFTAIYIPIRIAFLEEVDLGLLIIEYTIDGIFILDLGINFFIAYYGKNKGLITNNKTIIKHYLKGWFLIDFIACFPFGLLENSTGQNEMGYNRLLRLIRLSRLYRILKILNLLRVLDVLKKSKTYQKFLIAMKMNGGIKRLIKTIFTFFLVMHFFGCFWFYLARFNDFEPNTWVMRNGIRDMSPMSQYLISFCWVMTLSTIGYGDIIPFTKSERFLSLFYIIVGVGFVSYSIGSLSSIMLSSDSKKLKYKEKILVLDELAMNLKMKSDLYYKIKSIIRNNHETNFFSDMSHDALLEELPTSLRSQLITLIYQQNNLGVIAFFHGKNPEFLNEIMPLLRRITLEKDEIIYRDGDWADERSVKLVSEDNYIFRNYITGSYFGECEIVRKTDFRNEAAIASEACELLTLRKADLNKLLEIHVDVKNEFLSVIEKRNYKNVESLEKARKSSRRLQGLMLDRLNNGKKSIFNATEITKVSRKRGSIWRTIESPQEGKFVNLKDVDMIPEESDSDDLSGDNSSSSKEEKSLSKVNENLNSEKSINLDEIILEKNCTEDSVNRAHYSLISEGRNEKIEMYNFEHNTCKLDNPPSCTNAQKIKKKFVEKENLDGASRPHIKPVIHEYEVAHIHISEEEIKQEENKQITSFSPSNSESENERYSISSMPFSEKYYHMNSKMINRTSLFQGQNLLAPPTPGSTHSKADLNSIKREIYRTKRELSKFSEIIISHENYNVTMLRELREELKLLKESREKDQGSISTNIPHTFTRQHSTFKRQCTNAITSLEYKDWRRLNTKHSKFKN